VWLLPTTLLAQDRVASAYDAYRAGEYSAAVTALSAELRSQPGADAVVLLARVLRETGRYDEAEELLRRNVDTYPARSALEVELGETLHTTGNDAEATVLFQRAASSGGDGALQARLRLAQIRVRAGRAEEGESLLRSIVAEYNGGQVRTAQQLAAVAGALTLMGRRDYSRLRDALRLYDQAIAADSTYLDAQVALGNLFLSKFNGTDASATFQVALSRNPHHPSALLGLARARRFEGASDAFDLVEQSLETNPNLVAARTFRARQYLDLEDYAAADEEGARALAIDPRNPEAHAMRTASALLSGDGALYAERLAVARDVAPHDPQVFLSLSEVAARNRLYRLAVEFADSALALDSISWRGYALRGINRLRIGLMIGGRADLEVAFAGDPFDVWTKNTLDLLDDLDEYREVTTERFVFAVPGQQSDLLALYMVPLAEAAWDSLTAHYGIAPATPLRVEVYPREADFSVRTIGLVGMGALGVSFGPVIAMDAPSARPEGSFHWGSTLWHELAHSFHMAVSGSRVPRWFTEGLAVFEERRARPGWGDRIGWQFLLAYLQDRLAPVEDLNQGFMRPAYPQQIGFSYYQSSLVFDFIAQRWGFDAIVDMLRGYGEGANTPDIFTTTLGLDLEAFATAYDDYFRERFAGPLAALAMAEDGPGASLDEMRERADRDSTDFLAHLFTGRALMETEPDSSLPYLERAKALFPEYAGGDSPYWLLAAAHHRSGRLGKVQVELEALTTRNRAHYPGLRMLTEVRLQLADTSSALDPLGDVQYLYPYQEEDHRLLALGFSGEGETMLALRERRAILALNPFNRAEALLGLAQAQWAAGQRRTARSTVLQALEQAPNYQEALDLLLEIREDRP
jgi:tetratricopeptide (TPR) repeat protein